MRRERFRSILYSFLQNIMTFNKCSVRGKCFGDVIDESTGEPLNPEEV